MTTGPGRDGRADECGGLENRYAGNGIVGSNPTPSATLSSIAGDKAYQNTMANSDKQNAGIERDKALERAMTEQVADHAELFKQFSDNESFRRWLSEMNFASTYLVPVTSASVPGDRVGQ